MESPSARLFIAGVLSNKKVDAVASAQQIYSDI